VRETTSAFSGRGLTGKDEEERERKREREREREKVCESDRER
jgi:hypothetical protein